MSFKYIPITDAADVVFSFLAARKRSLKKYSL